MKFKLVANFRPTGDQPEAIAKLADGLKKGYRDQTLLGVTGSGKTFTMAAVIAKIQKPTLVISHNKLWPPSFTANSNNSFRKTRCIISFPTTTITSPKPICRKPTLT